MPSPSKIVKALAVFAACLFVIVYMYHQIIGVRTEGPQTETALAVSLENTIPCVGYIFRDETVIRNNAGGTVFSVVGDGEKVAGGKNVANVYMTDNDAGSKSRIDEIDEKLEILESSTIDQEYFSADVTKLEKDKNELIKSVIKSKANNDFSDCISKKHSLLVSMNKLAVVKHGASFTEKIAGLTKEKNALSAHDGSYTRIYAPVSGYYSGIVDGYEELFVPDVLEKMSIDDFNRITGSSSDNSIISGNAGKIVLNSRWYLACKLPKSSLAPFEENKNYKIGFPSSSNIEIDMELQRIVSETDKDETVLVFTSNVRPKNFDYSRMQNIRIISERYSGLKVPKNAMRMLPDGTKGVYILIGETVHFRRAEEIYQSDSFYIIREETDEEKQSENQSQQDTQTQDSDGSKTDLTENNKTSSYRYLKLYDNVIIEGKDLFDGKRIDY